LTRTKAYTVGATRALRGLPGSDTLELNMWGPHRVLVAGALASIACFATRTSFALETGPEPEVVPAARAPASPAAASSTPIAAVPAADRSTVSAGVVNTNHIDTVVVAEPGSNVTVHGHGGPDRYAPDPTRKAAVIASPILFGIGGAVFGTAYLTQKASETCTYTSTGPPVCTHDDPVPALVAYDLTVAIVPSIPRWIVGDVNGALIYTGLRGASVLLASVVSWGSDHSSWMGPFMLGFAVPVTLGIVDLATTPHREDLHPHEGSPAESGAAAVSGFRVTSVAPAPLTDAEHRVRGAMIGLSAAF
jgi:hypothetical protein